MSESGSDHVFDDTTDPDISREGLPREYRMRADRHYVDQLVAASSGPPVRMIPVTALNTSNVAASGTLRHLIESIRRHGIVHPLLVRRQDGRYVVIAGHKRLVAATTLRLGAVPCLVYDVTEAEASALAEADNLRVSLGTSGSDRPDDSRLTEVVGTHIGPPFERDHNASRSDGDEALLSALAAKAWAELHEGEIRLERGANGSRLIVVVGRTS